MITFRTISTGSLYGNCHLIDADNEYLFLDLGISIASLKKAIDFNVSCITGAVVTHAHVDHSKCESALLQMGKAVFAPYHRDDRAERIRTSMGNFIVDAFALTDVDKTHFVHTNTDDTECKNYAFYIRHIKYPDWNLFYATDCAYIKWKIPNLKNVVLGVDYADEMLDRTESKTTHQICGHFSIDSCVNFVQANNPSGAIVLTHLSDKNADGDMFKSKIKEVTSVMVEVARPGLTI